MNKGRAKSKDKCEGRKVDKTKKYASAKLFLEATRIEYEHSFETSQKLDNKIYITLTFCGVIFLSIVNLLDLTCVKLPINTTEGLFKTVLFIMLVIFSLIFLVGATYRLIKLTKPSGYARVNCRYFYDKHLYNLVEEKMAMYVAAKYLDCKDINTKENEGRATRYKVAIQHILYGTGTMLIAHFIKFNFL